MAIMPVEWGKIREYAAATANARTEYMADPKGPIPPTFLATVVFWDALERTFELPEAAEAFDRVGLTRDVRRLLSLEQEYVFHGPLPRAGDVLETSARFDGVEVKQARSGPMILVRFAVEFRGQDGALRAECLYTSAYLNPPRADEPPAADTAVAAGQVAS